MSGPSIRPLALLSALTAALLAAFVLVPGPLASVGTTSDLADPGHLRAGLRAAYAEYWRSGERRFPSSLDTVVDYWFRYHVIKAVIAASTLTVLLLLGALVWKAFLRAGSRWKRAGAAAAGVLIAVVGLAALATVMANVQGAAAPFASLLPMLTDSPADPELAETLTQVTQALSGGSSATTPALEATITDFARYHAALAVIAAIVAVMGIATGVTLLRPAYVRKASDRRTRRLVRAFGVLFLTLSLAMIAIAAANVGTAAVPEPALLAFFEGSW